MKNSKLIRCAILGAASLMGLAACGTTAAPEAKLVASYISPAKLSYNNMRPTYNYYLTTYDFFVLEEYSDNTYCLTFSTSTFSGLIIPEEGNAAQGNERDNSLWKYYGTITEKKADDLDPETMYYTLSEATRIIATVDSGYFVDTDNWTEDMKTKSADKTYAYDAESGTQTVTGTKEYATGAEYLAAKTITETKATVNTGSATLDYLTLTKKAA